MFGPYDNVYCKILLPLLTQRKLSFKNERRYFFESHLPNVKVFDTFWEEHPFKLKVGTNIMVVEQTIVTDGTKTDWLCPCFVPVAVKK